MTKSFSLEGSSVTLQSGEDCNSGNLVVFGIPSYYRLIHEHIFEIPKVFQSQASLPMTNDRDRKRFLGLHIPAHQVRNLVTNDS